MPAAKPATAEAYLAALPADRRAALETLHQAIRKTVPQLSPEMISGIIGYGKYRYKSKSCEGEWFIVGLANRAACMSLYICAADKNGYLAEQNAQRLGKVKVGKSCINFKKLEDLNLEAALALVKKAEKLGGLAAAM